MTLVLMLLLVLFVMVCLSRRGYHSDCYNAARVGSRGASDQRHLVTHSRDRCRSD